MNSTAQRALVFALLVLLLVSTRLNLPTSVTHFGPVPDASWAAFFLGGFYLRAWTRWAFPAFMALAVLVDYVVISGQGMDFFAHYCMSAAYWFLVPAYFALWSGGMLTRRWYKEANGKALAVLAASLVGAVLVCHLLSQGSFYWLSDSVANPSVAGWTKNLADWFLPYLYTASIYVALAAVVHAAICLLGPAQAPAVERAPR